MRLASHGVRQWDGQKFHEIQYPARRYHMYRGLCEVESSDAMTKKKYMYILYVVKTNGLKQPQ